MNRRRVPAFVALVATAAGVWGAIVAVHYHQLGLTLSHYDARGHLVVARRIVDSITPGWQQIGAVWLPLPHLLNALPVQIDLFYRTGASAVAISVASFAIAAAAIASIVLTATGSALAAAAGVVVFALNPNVLYLQATPMTEPLLVALTTAAIATLVADTRQPQRPQNTQRRISSAVSAVSAVAFMEREGFSRASRDDFSRATAWLFALACLTRYEAWPVTAAALALAAWSRWRAGDPVRDAVRSTASIAVYPATAVLAFLVFSRVVIGEWFVSGGFFVPENKALGDASMAANELAWGVAALTSTPLAWLGAAGLAAAAVRGLVDRKHAAAIVVIALVATAILPFAAFYRGHPFRIRYMVPLVAAEAVGAGIAAGFIHRARAVAAVAVIALAASTLRPLDGGAPMVVEAQWDRPNAPVRAQVTACLGAPRPGEKIMASMGSLGHYMQEASEAGFEIRDFLHEGNGDLWLAALEHPRPYADWIAIEEKAQGGDMLARLARQQPRFLDGYERTCEGAGLALYRRK